MQLPLFLGLGLALASTLSAFSCGTAMAAGRKPGDKVKSNHKPSQAGKGLGMAISKQGKAVGTTSGTTRATSVPSPVPKNSEGWPVWAYPQMGQLLGRGLGTVLGKSPDEDPLAAAHAWDGMRAFALRLLGPDDPRVWACLARSARSLSDFLDRQTEWPQKWMEPRLLGATSMAAGAVESLRSASAAKPVSSVVLETSGPGCDKPAGEGPDKPAGEGPDKPAGEAPDKSAGEGPDKPDRKGQNTDRQKKAIEADIAFAEATLKECLSRCRALSFGTPPAPVRTLGAALYPGKQPQAGSDPFPSSRVLRERMEEADARVVATDEDPAGFDSVSREALVLRSRLGYELADSVGWEASEESLSLLTGASAGLQVLAGARDPDALAAKERLARRLFRMSGHGRILPEHFETCSLDDMNLSLKLFRELHELAPEGSPDDDLSLRSYLCSTEVILAMLKEFPSRPDRRHAPHSFDSTYEKVGEAVAHGPDIEMTRDSFDIGETMLRNGRRDSGERFHSLAMAGCRHIFGARHPETARSLARTGDIDRTNDMEDLACFYWCLALEALEGKGKRHERFRADLEFRTGRALIYAGDFVQAVPLLALSRERYANELGEMSQPALVSAAHLGVARFCSDDESAARETFGEIVRLLDGAPARSDPDPGMPSDADVLSTALAGLGADAISSDDRPRGEALFRRSLELLQDTAEKSPLAKLGDALRSVMPDLQHPTGKGDERA
jgi:hypothetical protein